MEVPNDRLGGFFHGCRRCRTNEYCVWSEEVCRTYEDTIFPFSSLVQPAEDCVLSFVPADHQFRLFIQAKVASEGQKLAIPKCGIMLMVEQIKHLWSEIRFRQLTTARCIWDVAKAELSCQGL